MPSINGLQDTNISEEQVIVAFHSFLQGALAQAHAEKLLDASILSSAEADIQILGPAICLFLAALRSEGNPPRIATSVLSLNADNCPASFRNWFLLWSESVPKIKALPPEFRHDLARIICDQEPQCQPIPIELPLLAQNLRAIAIQISQRRTFQERFHQDLDYAIQFGNHSNAPTPQRPSATFRPPPAYDEESPHRPASATPPKLPPRRTSSSLPEPPTNYTGDPNTQFSYTNAFENHPALGIIRETLYASLTDILYTTPTVMNILQSKESTDAELSRAYFAALSLAILDVSLSLVDPMECRVRVVNLGNGYPSLLKAEDCPPHLRPLMAQLLSIAAHTQRLAHEDHQIAIESAANGNDPVQSKMERLRNELQQGINWEAGLGPDGIANRAVTPTGTVRAAANQINALALTISLIPSFRQREEALFEILVPVLGERKKDKSAINR